MENFDEIVFDDEEFLDDEFDSTSSTSEEPPHQEDSQEDLTSEILRIKGITDPNKIKFEDETGAVIERSWNNLSKEEQINILVGEEEKPDLSDEEIAFLNDLRNSGLTIQDYLQTLHPAQEVQTTSQYKVSELSDDDLYILDILEKVGNDNITDEELSEALESAKKNEKLYQKTVEGLRQQYTQLEKDQEMKQANEQALRQQQNYEKFANSILTEIRGLNSFAGQDLEMSNEDIDELSRFLLDIDENGMSPFGKAMQDPKLFTKAAFWLLNEDKIIEELTKQMQDTYKRGYENAKKDMQGKSKLVFKNTTKPQPKDDGFVDDDEW